MELELEHPGFERTATFDIETTSTDPEEGQLVSIGVGIHEEGTPTSEAEYETFHRKTSYKEDEVELIRRSMRRLEEVDPDGIVSYNGLGFDLDFISERLDIAEGDVEVPELIKQPDSHIDVFKPRMDKANRTGAKWPSLEECLDSYEFPKPRTIWEDSEVTNSIFGEDLGPRYLVRASNDEPEANRLQEVIDHYLMTDLEANFLLYYADVGYTEVEPHLVTDRKNF